MFGCFLIFPSPFCLCILLFLPATDDVVDQASLWIGKYPRMLIPAFENSWDVTWNIFCLIAVSALAFPRFLFLLYSLSSVFCSSSIGTHILHYVMSWYVASSPICFFGTAFLCCVLSLVGSRGQRLLTVCSKCTATVCRFSSRLV